MSKIHILSHHVNDIAMCGIRGNNIELSDDMSQITCSRCKMYANEFNNYINNVFEFKIGDIYEKDFHRKYEINKICENVVVCYVLNCDFKRIVAYPKIDNSSKYQVVIMEKRRISCYTKLNKGEIKGETK